MSIRFSKYIDITSGVGGASQVPTRQWSARVFTTSNLVNPDSVLQFPSSDDVGLFFGTASEEYKFAVQYFSYVSPNIRKPYAIQFARYVNADQPVTIFGAASVANLTALKLVTAGHLIFTLGSTNVEIDTLNFSAATSLADVASELQTQLRTISNPVFASCTVTYDATRQAFEFTGSPTGVTNLTFGVTQAGSGNTNAGAALGFYTSQGALVNNARVMETPVASFSRVMGLSNNCGSFRFTDTAALALSDVTAVAQANAALNVTFIYRVRVDGSNYATYSAALIGIAGLGLEYQDASKEGIEYIEALPMAVQGSTNYTIVNGASGYMYRQNSNAFTPSVSDDTLSDTLDAARVNYYGETQTAGQKISFYQRGVLCGGATAPQDSTIYANEQWFKDYVAAQLMNLQLSQQQISADAQGQGILDGGIRAAIDIALTNGTIRAKGVLNQTQKAYITTQTNDATAWVQIQNSGWWFASTVQSTIAQSGVTEYSYNYTLLYRKDDIIKTIVGSHQLI